MTARAFLVVLALILAAAPARGEIRIGSKKFTESVILGEIARQAAVSVGQVARHRRELGGTRILWNALLRGDIDVYPDYTGTLMRETLASLGLADVEALRAALDRHGLAMTRPLGFNNTYAIGMRADKAKALGIRAISDLNRHPGLILGFGNEFLDRADGWPALKRRYRLAHRDVRGLDHDLAYRGLAAGDIDVMDIYSTDAEIAYYGLAVLADNLGHFPAYRAVYVYRRELARTAPEFIAALDGLAGRISDAAMIAMNRAVKIDRVRESRVAARFLGTAGESEAAGPAVPSMAHRIARRTGEHLILVAISLGAAIALALPLGILAARRRRLGEIVLAAAGMIQTIPALALLVMMIPLLGIGGPPAMVALFLYSLLPILRNTHAGIANIPAPLRLSAEALGLSAARRLVAIELPLALPLILAGVKTAAVINIGTATLGALIGAGGYGQPILTGIRLDDTALILEGAVPAAVLALATQGLFELAERGLVPRGLRPS